MTTAFAVPERPEVAPARADFVEFPARMGQLNGTREAMDPVFLDALRLDDYLLMNYLGAGDLPINLYVAYYRSQRSGMSVHSPRLCLPGGGWQIRRFEQYTVPAGGGHPRLPVNRVLIEKGGQRQLVYYWFLERTGGSPMSTWSVGISSGMR